MGWLAYAVVNKNELYCSKELLNYHQCELFFNATKNSGVEGYYKDELLNGVISGKVCNRMLSQATSHLPFSTYSEKGWSAEDVRKINKHARWWMCEYEDEEKWSFLVVKYYLRACSLMGVGIKFSY